MSFLALNLVVIGQIVVFQFASVPFTRSVFEARLGDLPHPLSTRSDDYLRKGARYRFALGAVLLVAALACTLGLPSDPQTRKLMLAVVSLISSAAFAIASFRDRRTVNALHRQLPDAGRRRASLRPRSISLWYHTSWEVLPVAVFLVTAGLTAVLARRLDPVPTEMWLLVSLQGAFVIGALLYTYRYGTGVPNVSSRLALFRERPELALEFGERLAEKEMRYFMQAKISVSLLLGVSAVPPSTP
jgi:hypothetical protein